MDDNCRDCGASLEDGEGWDGLCGNCADIAEGDAPCLVCECYYPNGQRCPNPECPLH